MNRCHYCGQTQPGEMEVDTGMVPRARYEAAVRRIGELHSELVYFKDKVDMLLVQDP